MHAHQLNEANARERRRSHVAAIASSALLLFGGASASRSSPGSIGSSALSSLDDKVEKFEKVDPYTHGARKDLDRAGYISFGPFPIADGIKTTDVELTLGSIPMLWVETAHFKLGSTLATYHCSPDERERRALHDELVHLAKKMPRAHGDFAKLDPWLRLHLYAQRLEEEYADLEARFGVTDADFAAKSGTDASASMGRGPFLGEELKFTVLLTELGSQVARFGKHWLATDDSTFYRGVLPGGSMFFGTSAQTAKASLASDLDLVLHSLVAGEIARNFCEAFRGATSARPVWFEHGLALFYARTIDERWSLYVPRSSAGEDDQSWHWEPRVSGLVVNDFVPKWDDMLSWTGAAKLETPAHLAAWSRVSWLLGQDKAKLHAYWMAVTEPVRPSSVPDTAGSAVERDKAALHAAYGGAPAELDRLWRKWVARTYARK
jgi:hypothetical protein